MNWLAYALVALRSSALVLGLQGRQTESNALAAVANALESGRNVDAHMSIVAEALKQGTAADWQGVLDRIENDSARLQGA